MSFSYVNGRDRGSDALAILGECWRANLLIRLTNLLN